MRRSWCVRSGLLVALLGACSSPTAGPGPGDAGAVDDVVTAQDLGVDVGSAPVDAACPAGETACGGRCVSLQDSREHCGACGNACPNGQVCAMGACAIACPAGQSVCAGRCVDVRTDRAHCGACGVTCARGEVCSDGRCGLECADTLAVCATGAGDGGAARFCADTRTDPRHCGACGNACSAGSSCVGGRCVTACSAGLTACGDRCVDTRYDPANCGACGRACASGEVCDGTCRSVCGTGTTRCGDRCRDLSNDPAHCGACDRACPQGQRCGDGACLAAGCPSPLSTCGGACVDTRYDPDHCGGCGRACTPYPNLTRACGNGACVPGVCLTGFADCNTMIVDGCEVSTQSDPNNCGACGRACTSLPNASAMCAGGACSIGMCNANFANCDGQAMNGCEVNLQTDRTHCGACGNTCPTGRVCIMGACASQPLYRGWTSPIPGCRTDTYNTTAPTNLGGTYPFITGDSNACRAWKLAATVCTTQPQAYVDNNNWQCPVSGGFTDPVFGTYCLRTGQYSCSTCPGACNAQCAYNPLSLRDCAGSERAQQ
jgi:hypothetical protein